MGKIYFKFDTVEPIAVPVVACERFVLVVVVKGCVLTSLHLLNIFSWNVNHSTLEVSWNLM